MEELFDRVQRKGLEDPPMTIEQMCAYNELIQRPTLEEMSRFDPPATL